jgi:hypothetical protein
VAFGANTEKFHGVLLSIEFSWTSRRQ